MLEIAGKKLLTAPEAAEMLHVNVQTVRRWIAAGKLPAQRLGRPVYILENDLLALFENTRVKPKGEAKTIEVKINPSN